MCIQSRQDVIEITVPKSLAVVTEVTVMLLTVRDICCAWRSGWGAGGRRSLPMEGSVAQDLHHLEGNRGGRLFVMVGLSIPSFFALLAAAFHSSGHSAPGLWFFYEVPRNVGYLGIALATGLTWVTFRHRSVSARNGSIDDVFHIRRDHFIVVCQPCVWAVVIARRIALVISVRA